MKKDSLLKRILVSLGVAVASIGVIALGVSLGNKGLKSAIDETKEKWDKIKDVVTGEDEKTSSDSTTTARVNGHVYTINFVD